MYFVDGKFIYLPEKLIGRAETLVSRQTVSSLARISVQMIIYFDANTPRKKFIKRQRILTREWF